MKPLETVGQQAAGKVLLTYVSLNNSDGKQNTGPVSWWLHCVPLLHANWNGPDGSTCWLYYRPLLRENGFPQSTWEDMTNWVDDKIGMYRSRLQSKPPRDSELVAELSRIITNTGTLLNDLQSMSQRCRYNILDAKVYSAAGVINDPWILKGSIEELERRAEIVLGQTPEDSTGRETNNAFADLLLQIGILWRVRFPDGKGITMVKDEYRGRMLQFVVAVLRIHPDVTQTSEQAIGRRLYHLRARIDELAARDRAAEITSQTLSSSRRITKREAPARNPQQ